MMLEVKPVPLTTLSIPIAREQIVEAILVVRTKDGVEVAGELTQRERCKALLGDGLARLCNMPAVDIQKI